MLHYKKIILVLSIFLLSLYGQALRGQDILLQRFSIDIEQQPLGEALKRIGHQGAFYFSYNSNLLPQDSLVDIHARNQPLKSMLLSLLGPGYMLTEKKEYVIISSGTGHIVELSGTVTNHISGGKISNVSISVPQAFKTTLSDTSGRFYLRFKNRHPRIHVQVNRTGYKDTSFYVEPGVWENLQIPLEPMRNITLPQVDVRASSMDTMLLSRLFISSKQKIRDMNLSDFFVRQPFQYAIWPGIGTHGKMSAQAVNKFSLNIFGGYAGGVHGFELGGLFNMDREHVKQSLQIAGIFNVVGGNVSGLQIAGIYNRVGGRLEGIQLGGAINKVGYLGGLQIGMVNISDSSRGYSLGLVNIVKQRGYYKLALSYDVHNRAQVAFKSGREKLYNIVLGTAGLGESSRVFSVGYGLGTTFPVSQRNLLTAELTAEAYVVGYKQDSPVRIHLQPAFHQKLGDRFSLFAGPALSLYMPGTSVPKGGGSDPMLPAHHFSLLPKLKGWLGLQVGVQLF